MSPIQSFGLELAMIEDQYLSATLRGQELSYAIRNALITAGASIEKLYPEFIKKEEIVVQESDITSKDIEDPSGGWKFTNEMSPDDIMSVLQQLGQQVPVGAIPGAPLHDDEGWR
jgi:hypothetical protein